MRHDSSSLRCAYHVMKCHLLHSVRLPHTSSTLKTEVNLTLLWLYDDNVIYMQLIPSKIAACR